MSPAEPPSDDATDARRPDYRQVAFVALAILGLVLASFVAPALPTPNAGGGGDGEGGGGGQPPDGEFGPGPAPEPGELERIDDTYRRCQIQLNRQPVPGASVEVRVLLDGDPIADAEVFFNGESIGLTDVRGEVSGQVPYNQTLTVRVESQAFDGCEFRTDASGLAGSLAAGADAASPTLAQAKRQTAAELAQADSPNATVTYEVTGEIDIQLLGPPYPGEEIEIVAEIDGVPVQDAVVTVDGEQVATTDDTGRAVIPIPDDGSSRVTLAVARGEFSGSRPVPVLLLRTTLVPDGPLLVPGGDATVVAAVGSAPPADATVTVDGERVGETDRLGRAPITVPTDPTASITVTTERQSTTVSLLSLYGVPAILTALFVLIFSALLWYIFDWRAALVPPALTLTVLGILVVQSYLGGYSGLLATGAVLGVLLLVAVVKWRRAVASGAVSTGGFLAELVETLVRGVLSLVGSLSTVADWALSAARRLAGWVRSLPRSVSGLARRFAAGLVALPGRLLAGIRATPISKWTVAWTLGVVAATGAGYVVWGLRGALAAGVLSLLAAVGWYLRTRDGDEASEDSAADDESTTTGAATEAVDAPAGLTLREVYRRVARLVQPDGWRTRTAAEIAATGIERGYPERPMRDLAEAFREVEYGDRSLSATAGERVRAAYEAVIEADGAEEPEDSRGDGA